MRIPTVAGNGRSRSIDLIGRLLELARRLRDDTIVET